MRRLIGAMSLYFFVAINVNANPCSFLEEKSKKSSGADVATSELIKGDLIQVESKDLRNCKSLTTNPRNPGQPLSISQLEQVRDELLAATNQQTVWDRFQRLSLDRLVDCMIVNGTFQTCFCLSEELPLVLTYPQYVAVVTSSPGLTPSHFGVTDAEYSKLVGKVWSARDQCVTQR